MDIGFHRRRVEPQTLSADRFLRHGVPGERLIDLLPGLGSDGVAKAAEGRIIHHRPSIDSYKTTKCRTRIHADRGLPQRKAFNDLAHAKPKHRVAGIPRTPFALYRLGQRLQRGGRDFAAEEIRQLFEDVSLQLREDRRHSRHRRNANGAGGLFVIEPGNPALSPR